MPYVQRDSTGAICGTYANLQPGYAEEWLADDDAAVVAFVTPQPVPEHLSRVQFFQVLALSSLITQDEALAAVAGGTIPAGFLAFIGTLPADQQFSFKMLLSGSQTFDRLHPFVIAFADSRTPPMTSDQVNALWTQGATL